MIRFLSVILLLAGLVAVAWGAMQLASPPEASYETASAPIFEESLPEAAIETESLPDLGSGGPAEANEPGGDIGLALDGAAEDASGGLGIGAPEPPELFSTTAMVPRPSLADELRLVPIAYETPEAARFGEAFDVTLSIDGTGNAEITATGALPGEARITEAEAAVSERVKASLLGSAFEIASLSPDVQLISPATPNVWRWRVTPQEVGEHRLIVEIFAMENGEALPVKTFTGSVIVSISRLRQAISIATEANPIAMVLGGIGSALAGLLGVFRVFRGR